MAYEIRIERVFSAAHQLRLPGGAVEPLHGHDWRVRITVASDELDAIGCVMDFHVLEATLEKVISPLHNSNLNDAPAFRQTNPSAENVATFLGKSVLPVLPEGVWLARADVTEAPGCRAAYVPMKPIKPTKQEPYHSDPGPFG